MRGIDSVPRLARAGSGRSMQGNARSSFVPATKAWAREFLVHINKSSVPEFPKAAGEKKDILEKGGEVDTHLDVRPAIKLQCCIA